MADAVNLGKQPQPLTGQLEQHILALRINVKWAVATATIVTSPVPDSGYVHMMIDDQLPALLALAPLPGGALIGDVCARLNLLKGFQLDHYQGVGSLFVDGEHLDGDAPNTATLSAIPDASDLASAIVLISGMGNSVSAPIPGVIVNHGWLDSDAGHHFHDDQSTGGRDFVLPVDPPVLLADCIVDTNAILASLIVHFQNGVPL